MANLLFSPRLLETSFMALLFFGVRGRDGNEPLLSVYPHPRHYTGLSQLYKPGFESSFNASSPSCLLCTILVSCETPALSTSSDSVQRPGWFGIIEMLLNMLAHVMGSD